MKTVTRKLTMANETSIEKHFTNPNNFLQFRSV